MFEDGNYAGCIDKLNEFIKTVPEAFLLEESEYLLMACDYKQGKKSILDSLEEFLGKNPETIHRDDICFMIASCYFERKDYSRAGFWFGQTNINNLSKQDGEDHTFRMAFASLQQKEYDEAYRLFGCLSENSTKYKDAASYYIGCIHYAKKEYNNALQQFNQLKNKQFKSEVLYYITHINFTQGRFAQTITSGKELLAAFPDSNRTSELNRIIGISYYEEGDYANSSQHLLAYMETAELPSQEDTYLLGISLFHTQKYHDAIPFLSSSASVDDTIGQSANLFLGQAYLKTENPKNALTAFAAASESDFDPSVKEAAMYNYAILLCQASTATFDESIAVLENFLNLYPNSTYADKVSDCLIEIYMTTKDYDAALQSINRIKHPGRQMLEAKQKIYYHLGTIYFTNTQYKTAIDYFTKAIDLENYAPQEKALANYWRGESFYRMNEYDSAIKDFQTFRESGGIKSGNTAVLVYYSLGYCYFSKGQFSVALDYFSDYIKQEKDNSKINMADAYARLGDCYFESRNFASAENAYTKSATLQPQMADYAIFQKGLILGIQKKYHEKIEQMNKVMKNHPDSRYIPDALYEKGRAYVMLDNSKLAIETYNLLWDNYPNSQWARKAGVQIGLLYFNSNETQKSAAAYKQVIAKYPGSEEAKVALQDLKSVYVDLNDIEAYARYVNALDGMVRLEASEQDSLTYLSAERLFSTGNTAQAQTALTKYLQNFPNGGFVNKANYYLGSIYLGQGQNSLAKAAFENVLKLDNNAFTENALVHLADIQYSGKDYAAALANYSKLNYMAENKSNVKIALLGIMRCAGALKKSADVLNAASKLLKEPGLSPEISAEAQYLVAQSYFDSKQYDMAESEALAFIKAGTSHEYWMARSIVLLSDVYVVKNDYAGARQYLESLRQTYKQNDDIQGMINERLSKK